MSSNLFPINGFEDYLITKDGRVWMKEKHVVGPKRTYTMKAKWLKTPKDSSGYPTVRLNQKTYRVHRLMAQVFLGCKNNEITDHINRVKDDNRLENLRVCGPMGNTHNSPPRRGRKFKGTQRRGNRWWFQIPFNGTNKHVGSFDTEEDAARAYDEEARRLHGEFAYQNFI